MHDITLFSTYSQMISERVLKGQTDKLYFCTSLAPPNVIPSGSLALLLSPSTTTTQMNMDLPTPDVEGYKDGGNTSACYQQLLQVVAASSGGQGDNKQTPRAFAFEIASKVGDEFYQHNSTSELLEDMTAELNKQGAARHSGLCGYPHAWVIAAVKTQDVDKMVLYYWQQVSQPREIIFLLALHACYMNARSYSCSL